MIKIYKIGDMLPYARVATSRCIKNLIVNKLIFLMSKKLYFEYDDYY